MWIFSTLGAYSVVDDPSDEDRVVVRARLRGDLEALREGYIREMSPIEVSEARDYRFRSRCRREAWAVALARLAMRGRYPSFKDEIGRAQGPAREAAYHEIWHVWRQAAERLRRDGARTSQVRRRR